MKKDCGECTLCCLVLPIHEVNSKPSELCSHCDLKIGCTIYDTRPTSCINFNCSWLVDDDMIDPLLRPDKSHAIFERVTDEIHIATLDPYNITAWNTKPVLDYMEKLKSKGISIIVTSFTNNPKLFMLAEGKTKEGIMREAMEELKKAEK